MKKNILSALMLIASTGLFAQVTTYTVGDVVDNFTVTDTEGNEWTLYDLTAQGKYVYLDFFFDTCGPCQNTTPLFNEFHDKYGCNEGSLFMMSMNDGSDTDAEVIAFENTFGGSFEHAPAISGDGGAAVVDTAFGVNAYPTFALIGADNTLLESDIWPISNVGTFEATIPSAANAQVMSCSLGIDTAALFDFSLYPNPVSNNTINLLLGANINSATVTIYNVLGSVVYAQQHNTNQITITADIVSGSYIVSVETLEGTLNKSLVVE